jgi:hypothetical protein
VWREATSSDGTWVRKCWQSYLRRGSARAAWPPERRSFAIEGVGRTAREPQDELQRGLHAESLADREVYTYPVGDLCEATLDEGTVATIRVILDGPAPDGPARATALRPSTRCWSCLVTDCTYVLLDVSRGSPNPFPEPEP